MSTVIAITGKGGVGKTTCAALMIGSLVRRGCHPVLAVDADPNTCLDVALGMPASKTVGAVREEARQLAGQGLAAGISKQELLELKISESLVEGDCVDLIAMGRPEGPGCYCYANSVLKQVLGEIAHHYPFVVLDNEAGLENLSRRLVREVDLLVLVADPSRRGLDTLRRLYDLANEMQIQYRRLAVIVNRVRAHGTAPPLAALRQAFGAAAAIAVPDDDAVAALGEAGASMAALPPGNPVAVTIDAFLQETGVSICPKNPGRPRNG